MEMVKTALFLFTFAVAVAASTEAPAPAPAEGAADECLTVLLNLQDCLNYVSVGSAATEPSTSCCVGLQKVVDSNPKCLCKGFSIAQQAGVSVDPAKASALPSSCKPPVNAAPCSLSPAGAPTSDAASPSASSPSSENTSPTAAAPGPSSSSNSGFALSAGSLLAALALVVAYFSSF